MGQLRTVWPWPQSNFSPHKKRVAEAVVVGTIKVHLFLQPVGEPSGLRVAARSLPRQALEKVGDEREIKLFDFCLWMRVVHDSWIVM